MTFAHASVERSVTNAATSAGVGGSPIRSNVVRRISVRRSAVAAGERPFASSAASMKVSIGDLTQERARTVGLTGRLTGRNDQWRAPPAVEAEESGFAVGSRPSLA